MCEQTCQNHSHGLNSDHLFWSEDPDSFRYLPIQCVFSTSGGVQCIRGYLEYIRGYLEYTGDFSTSEGTMSTSEDTMSTSEDIMIHVGSKLMKAFDLY